MLKILVKTYGCLGSGTTVGTQVLCHSVLVHHLTGYSVARFVYKLVTVLYFLGLIVTFYATDCEWHWGILFFFDKRMHLGFYLFFFFPSSVDFEYHIGNTSERVNNRVKCNFDVKSISNHIFIFSSIATLCFDFEVINSSKFILYSIFLGSMQDSWCTVNYESLYISLLFNIFLQSSCADIEKDRIFGKNRIVRHMNILHLKCLFTLQSQ